MLLPRLASTGHIAGQDVAKALGQIKQFTEELAAVSDEVPSDDLLKYLKSIEQYAGDIDNRFNWMTGLLYEVSAAKRYIGQGAMSLQVRVMCLLLPILRLIESRAATNSSFVAFDRSRL